MVGVGVGVTSTLAALSLNSKVPVVRPIKVTGKAIRRAAKMPKELK
jgi:hypothetical protein